jgi:hypothetical protein
MVKQVSPSPQVKAKLAASYGDDSLDMAKLAVFEAVTLNTKPLLRKGGIFEGAMIQASVFPEMLAQLDTKHVPLIVMHGASMDPLPIGKAFASQIVFDETGAPMLNTMFYLPKTETDLVSRIDSGVVAEVSAGMKFNSLLCSACNWNYASAQATFDILIERTCTNGHVIGQNGVHLKCSNLADWIELSLVDRGAVDGAKILPRKAQQMGQLDAAKLAITGFDDRILNLFASVSDTQVPTNPGEPDMVDHTERLMTLSAEMATMKIGHESATAQVATLTANLAASTERVTTLEAELAEARTGEIVSLKAELKLAGDLIAEYATAALFSTGKKATDLPETISDRVALIGAARAQLALAIPTGGVSQPPAAVAPPPPANTHAAFKMKS